MADTREQPRPASRYRFRLEDGGLTILCRDSPNIRLLYRKGRTHSRHSGRSLGRQVVFLDGACNGAPFMDHGRRQYSLDHHAGCLRPFTMATCMQAATMVWMGMPLDEGSWRLVINGVDLDSLMSAWVLMNHAELARDERAGLASAMPLLQVEGMIDANGLDAGILLGMDTDLRREREALLTPLARRCREIQSLPARDAGDAIGELLDTMDTLMLPPGLLEGLEDITETGRVPLTNGAVALCCLSRRGIYETEEFLKGRLGSLLGLLVLTDGTGQYTIRLVSRFLRGSLEALWKHLNNLDPAVRGGKDPRNRWGGSSDIGGSPRQTGSELDDASVLMAIHDVYGEHVSALQRFLRQITFTPPPPRSARGIPAAPEEPAPGSPAGKPAEPAPKDGEGDHTA